MLFAAPTAAVVVPSRQSADGTRIVSGSLQPTARARLTTVVADASNGTARSASVGSGPYDPLPAGDGVSMMSGKASSTSFISATPGSRLAPSRSWASNHAGMSNSRWARTGPVSTPASMRWIVTPPRVWPSASCQNSGTAPRYAGSSDGWTLKMGGSAGDRGGAEDAVEAGDHDDVGRRPLDEIDHRRVAGGPWPEDGHARLLRQKVHASPGPPVAGEVGSPHMPIGEHGSALRLS